MFIATRFNELNPEAYLNHFSLIKNKVEKNSGNPISKYKKMSKLFKEIYQTFCTDALQKEYFVMENDFLIENNNALLSMASQFYELKNWAKLMDLENSIKKQRNTPSVQLR